MAYNNGNVSEADIRKMQQALGVDVDGKWGPQSSAAAGGLNADDAWTEFLGGGWYNPNATTSKKPAATTKPTVSTTPTTNIGYDNGNVSEADIKKMQEALGVTADGMWGKNSTDASGGLNADDAWTEFQGGGWYNPNTITPTTKPTTSTTPSASTTPSSNGTAVDKTPTTNDTTNTPTTSRPSNWTYDDFSVSAETADADANRNAIAAQRPGEFTYDDFKYSDNANNAFAAVDNHRENNKPGEFTYDAYQESDIVTQANNLLQQHLANKPGAYQSQWQNSLNDIMDKILNREKFSYDLNGDALYQQYKNQYTTQGQMAMMDTMGQAAALTGGYGSSYSQMVGQQAYQGYLQQLNDKVPELYQLALDQYNREGQDLYNQYGLYADRENQDYGRYRDTVSDYYANLDYLTEDARYKAEDDYGKYVDAYNRQYGQHRDSVSDYYSELDRLQEEARYQAQDEYGKYIDAYNREYGEHRDSVSDWQNEQNRADENYWNLYDRDYNQYTNDRQLDYSNYWNEKDFEEGVRQFDEVQKDSNTGSNPVSDPDDNAPVKTGYDNGNVSDDDIKKIQAALGVTADGKWGPDSTKAAGGLSADEAFAAYQSGKFGKIGETTLSKAAKDWMSKLRYPHAGSDISAWKTKAISSLEQAYYNGTLSADDVVAIAYEMGIDPSELLKK